MFTFGSQRWSIFAILAIAFSVGCSSTPAPQAKQNEKRDLVDEKPAAAHAGIQITPAAKTQIANIAATDRRIRVRLEFAPAAVGTTDVTTKLAIDTENPRPIDIVENCGDVDCVFLKEHFPLAQGAMIDWKEAENGFAVSFPNKTKENKDKSTYWLAAESDKRSRQKMEDDRANGRLAQRIADFRKLAADDPENELGHFRLGQLLAADGQTAEAVKSFERTLEISPDFPAAYRYLGECLIKLDQKERAITVLTKGWEIAQVRSLEYSRDVIAKLLITLGAPVPQKK